MGEKVDGNFDWMCFWVWIIVDTVRRGRVFVGILFFISWKFGGFVIFSFFSSFRFS